VGEVQYGCDPSASSGKIWGEKTYPHHAEGNRMTQKEKTFKGHGQKES